MKIDLSAYNPQERYLIGVSGGRDSVALLDTLLTAGFENLIVCHLDHGLRGRSSRADAVFVEKLAKSRGLKFMGAKADVAALAKKKHLSIETAAREARYQFFAAAARRHKCHAIFLAHHADDQVETFLFNLFRGAGTSGLAAMRPDTRRKIGATELRILRPLLGVSRSEIDAYVKKHALKFREDASNATTLPHRNKMRHTIIPALEKWFGRAIRKSVWRTAEILAAEDAWLASLTPLPAQELSVATLRKMPAAQQRRTIHAWLKSSNVPDAGFDEIESIRSLLPVSAKTAKINLPGDLHARRRAGKIFMA